MLTPITTNTRTRTIFAVLLLGLLASLIIATGLGFLRISPLEVIKVLAAKISGDTSLLAGINDVFPIVIMDVRLPRILTSAVVGGGLAVSGVIFQAILLNPLADPYTLGVSSGAAFGAALAIIANLSLLGFFSVPLFAFVGAIITLVAVMHLSSVDGRFSANTLILSGVIVAAILSAGIGFIKYMADEQVSVIIFWLMGSFASKTWFDVGLTSVIAATGLVTALFYSRDLNIMALGLRTSNSLGVETVRTRKILLFTGTLIAAVCVSVAGIIGFIGLIVPHLMRFLVGPDNRNLLPVSFLAGAILLLLADTITRAILPNEVPIGILTALIGGPFFCFIFRRKQLGRAND